MTPPRPDSTVLVIFGAAGDLARRKLIPALYNLFLDNWLPEHFAILGVDRQVMSDEAYRQHLRQGVDVFSRRGKTVDEQWDTFIPRVFYLAADFNDPGTYATIAQRMSSWDQEWGPPVNHIFYLATPPTVVEMIAEQMNKVWVAAEHPRTRLIAEKPFGHDLASATTLDRSLTRIFSERQIYRIDHYLGKETVQNILAFRFANSLWEPIWDQHYIDSVQITVAEEVGVEHRGGYYDHAGALRDMVQNHLLQVLSLIAMEPPVSFTADEIRNKKLDVLRAIRPITPDQVDQFAVRGQYGSGVIDGKRVPAYRREPNVAPNSTTETYVALKLFVDNWRWQGVPFYMRTGKRLAARVSEAVIQFRPVPHRSFPGSAVQHWQPNRLVIGIQPDEGIMLRFQAKQPGTSLRLQPVNMRFSYQETFGTETPEAYETLLLDVMRGDATLFMRGDQVETAWSVVMPILEGWEKLYVQDLPIYRSGTWGPEEADVLLAQDGRRWVAPTVAEEEEEEAPKSQPAPS